MQRSLSLTYRILCIWIWIRDCNRDWDWQWVGHSRMQLDKYAFGSNYTQKERTAAVVAHAHRVQAERTGQVGQQQQHHWQYRYNVEDQDWPGPVDPNSDCGCADNPFSHVDTYKRLYNYTAWKCDCQLVRTGQWKGRKLNCIKFYLYFFIFYVCFFGDFCVWKKWTRIAKEIRAMQMNKSEKKKFWGLWNLETFQFAYPALGTALHHTISVKHLVCVVKNSVQKRLNLHITNLRRTQANDNKLSQR